MSVMCLIITMSLGKDNVEKERNFRREAHFSLVIRPVYYFFGPFVNKNAVVD